MTLQNQRNENRNLLFLNTNGKLLSFNPYHGVAFFKFGNFLYFYHYDFNGSNDTNIWMVGYDPSVYDYIINCGHVLLKCLTSFACCLDKEVINCINFHTQNSLYHINSFVLLLLIYS